MIRQNRAVPILLVLTFAFILYLGGCFGTEEPETASEVTPTVVAATPTPPRVVGSDVDGGSSEEPFFHTVVEGDRFDAIASKYGVSRDVILRANPSLDPNILTVGQEIRIPGATTNVEALVEVGPERDDGVTLDYAVKSGDTMGAIAVEYTVKLESLIEANPDIDPANLQVNQLIVIPPWGTGFDPADLPARTTPVPQTRRPGDPVLEHTVAAGDFISAIADLYGVTTSLIVEANGLENNGNNIQVGQVLLIPPPLADEADEADTTTTTPDTSTEETTDSTTDSGGG